MYAFWHPEPLLNTTETHRKSSEVLPLLRATEESRHAFAIALVRRILVSLLMPICYSNFDSLRKFPSTTSLLIVDCRVVLSSPFYYLIVVSQVTGVNCARPRKHRRRGLIVQQHHQHPPTSSTEPTVFAPRCNPEEECDGGTGAIGIGSCNRVNACTSKTGKYISTTMQYFLLVFVTRTPNGPPLPTL